MRRSQQLQRRRKQPHRPSISSVSECTLDINVKPSTVTSWTLTDLLGRSLGTIDGAGETFTIHAKGFALETMDGISTGPFASLDDALAEIEKQTRGACRMV